MGLILSRLVKRFACLPYHRENLPRGRKDREKRISRFRASGRKPPCRSGDRVDPLNNGSNQFGRH